MKKTLPLVIVAATALVAWFAYSRFSNGEPDIEYRYSPTQKGEIVRSISATGVLVPLTTVDIKSKAGGKVVSLLVQEGDRVKAGDLIARIDPSDTRTIYEQASADVTSATVRAEQARRNYQLQVASSGNAVADAQANLAIAKARLERAEMQYKRQPALSEAALRSAEAAHKSAQEALRKFEKVTEPQARRDAQGAAARTEATLQAAEANLRRQEGLYQQGYVSAAVRDQARSSAAAARAEAATARQRLDTLEQDLATDRSAVQADLDRAKAALEQAEANQSDVDVSARNVMEARQSLRQAEIAVQRAHDEQITSEVRAGDIKAAEANAVRSRASLADAKTQLDSTTVVAPRDGVVTLKYLEEGTIIPPGTSTFSQGTSLVQMADTTQMFVECAVDEADFAEVRTGQAVRITAEAFPGREFPGVVERVNPSAQTENNITAIKVRVRILPGAKLNLLPGMNASCEFITLSIPDTLVVPSQSVQRDGGKTTVRVKGSDPLKPVVREVELGETGNDGVQVLSGLKEGEEVVVAEINLKELRDTQQRMQEAMQGGGLAGGQMGGRRNTGAGGRTGAGGAAGGSRSGGGMGGSR